MNSAFVQQCLNSAIVPCGAHSQIGGVLHRGARPPPAPAAFLKMSSASNRSSKPILCARIHCKYGVRELVPGMIECPPDGLCKRTSFVINQAAHGHWSSTPLGPQRSRVGQPLSRFPGSIYFVTHDD